jgi:hypothetical protein
MPIVHSQLPKSCHLMGYCIKPGRCDPGWFDQDAVCLGRLSWLHAFWFVFLLVPGYSLYSMSCALVGNSCWV